MPNQRRKVLRKVVRVCTSGWASHAGRRAPRSLARPGISFGTLERLLVDSWAEGE